jgi:hypothetical protein
MVPNVAGIELVERARIMNEGGVVVVVVTGRCEEEE